MYNDLSAIDTGYGRNIGGVCSFRFICREWLSGPVVVDKSTGTVNVWPPLKPGFAWLSVRCMEETMEYSEKVKSDKGGTYIEGTLSAIALRQELARHVNITALQYHELVVIITDSNKVQRIIGNQDKGMSFSADNTTGKQGKDATLYQLTLVHQMPEAAPIFEEL